MKFKKIMSNCVFSKKPYQKQGSYEFIKATKRGDLVTITKMFEVNRFWIFDFDDVLFCEKCLINIFFIIGLYDTFALGNKKRTS